MTQPRNTFHADLTGVLDMPRTSIRLICDGVLDYRYYKNALISRHRPGEFSVKQLRKKALGYLKRNGHRE